MKVYVAIACPRPGNTALPLVASSVLSIEEADNRLAWLVLVAAQDEEDVAERWTVHPAVEHEVR